MMKLVLAVFMLILLPLSAGADEITIGAGNQDAAKEVLVKYDFETR